MWATREKIQRIFEQSEDIQWGGGLKHEMDRIPSSPSARRLWLLYFSSDISHTVALVA